MKKLIVMCMLLAVVLAGVGCGAEKTDAPYSVDCIQALVDGGVFSEELESLEGDIPFALYVLADYGLTLKDLKECAAVRSAGGTCEEAAVLVFTGEDKAKTALTAMEDYLVSQIESNQNYRPNEIPKLEGAYLEQRGESVLLVVAGDDQAMKAVLAKY